MTEKVLVIEDNAGILRAFGNYDPHLFDLSQKLIKSEYNGEKFEYFEFDLLTAEDFLRTRKYQAVLLDGNLGLNLEGEYFDGKIVARRIRDGEYGELNRNVPIHSLSSSSNVFPGSLNVREDINKPRDIKGVECLVKTLALK